MEGALVRSSGELWKDYLFLTQEIGKFLAARDADLVVELLEQRSRLQELIVKTPDKGFKQSAEGRKILASIRKENQTITNKLQYIVNTSKQQQQISRAYSDAGGAFVSSYLDVKSK